MRISVCEFLRLQTRRNWYYVNPGHWASDSDKLEAFRVKDDKYEIKKAGHHLQTLHYFEGLPSNEVRKRVKRHTAHRSRRT